MSLDLAKIIIITCYPYQNFSFLIFLGIFGVIAVRNAKIGKRNTTAPMQENNKTMGYQNEGGNDIGRLEKLPNLYIWITIVSALALFLRTLYRLAETADGKFLLLVLASYTDRQGTHHGQMPCLRVGFPFQADLLYLSPFYLPITSQIFL